MPPHSPSALFDNIWIGCALAAWGVAQLCKLISAFVQTREFDFAYFASTGGMPSAHSASVAGLATSVGITHGFDSAELGLAFLLAGITMFDASTLRLAAGKQAMLLNEIVRELLHHHRLAQEPLKELLGHTRFEVFMGMLVGIFTAANMTLRWLARPPAP